MTQLQNVTLDKQANVYFDGKVTSRSVLFEDGTKVTLGIMLPGDYTFNTGLKEIMEITQGTLSYRLAGQDWVGIDGSGEFEVPANSQFELKVVALTDYCCHYIAE